MAFANLHTHTIFSDGKLLPYELVRHVMGLHDMELLASGEADTIEGKKKLAFRSQRNVQGLGIFALTDHDTLSGIEPTFRALKELKFYESGRQFIPGIELSLGTDKVHIAGFFPWIDKDDYRGKLAELIEGNPELSNYCEYRCNQTVKDKLDTRVRITFKYNLDGIADFYTQEEVIQFLREKGTQDNQKIWERCGKSDDIVQHPLPRNYPIMARYWAELLADKIYEKLGESLPKEQIKEILTERMESLYIPKPDGKLTAKLAKSYREFGIWSTTDAQADPEALARIHQGKLSQLEEGYEKPPEDDYMGVLEGHRLLKQAGAITSAEHPAVYFGKGGRFNTLEEYDQEVLLPLIEQGLDAVGLYPYDESFRAKANAHYSQIAEKHGLIIVGGTDYHADGRSKLDDIMVLTAEASKIITSDI